MLPNKTVLRLAKAIYEKRPDCMNKPWPLETDKQRRAYIHNPIAAVDLSIEYAKAAYKEIETIIKIGKEKADDYKSLTGLDL